MTKCRAGFATADKIKLQVKGFLLKIDQLRDIKRNMLSLGISVIS